MEIPPDDGLSRVALDLPAWLLLGCVSLVPLASIAFVYTLSVLGYLIPLKRNIFASPTDGLDPIPYVQSGKRGWKAWALAVLGLTHAVIWAVLSIESGVHLNGGDWKWPVAMGLTSLGWVSNSALRNDFLSGAIS